MDDDLLIKYILEEATPEENGRVRQWLAADAANHVRFEKLQTAWQLAARSGGRFSIDTPQALKRLKQTLQARKTAPGKRILLRAGAAAAMMAGLAGLALGAYVLIKPRGTVKEQPPVVKPDTVRHKQMRRDTVPAMLPAPALPADTFVEPRKKTLPVQVKPAQPVHTKKKAEQPTKPVDTSPIKKKDPVRSAVKPAPPVKKYLPDPKPAAPPAPGKKYKPDANPKQKK